MWRWGRSICCPFTVLLQPFTVLLLPSTVLLLPSTVLLLSFTAFHCPFTAFHCPFAAVHCLSQVIALVETAYKPTLKLVDYTLTPSGVRLFTHAPTRFDVLESLACLLRVVYDASTREDLARTLDKIHTKFVAGYRSTNRVHELCGGEAVPKCDAALPWPIIAFYSLSLTFHCLSTAFCSPGRMTPDEQQRFPAHYVLWNRWREEDETAGARPAMVNGYTVEYMHGHDPFQSELAHVVNLDTSCGKEGREQQRRKVKDPRSAYESCRSVGFSLFSQDSQQIAGLSG